MHGNKDCGHGDSRTDTAARIVSPGARKEKLRQRAWKPVASRASPRPYAELHAASAFSFLDGASPPEDLVGEAARLSLPAVALLDRNGVYGAPRFFKAARSAGLRALVGAEVNLEPTGRRGAGAPGRLTLLVENRAGYKNLCRLITAGASSISLSQKAACRER